MAARETDIIMDFIVNNKDLYETNKEINETVKEARKAGREAKKMASYYSDGYGEWRQKQKLLTDESRAMQQEMKYGWMANSEAYGKLLNDQIKARYGFYKLAKAGDEYNGTNKQWLNDIYALGAAQKKVNDEIIKNNVRMRQSFMQQAGMMANKTTQSQRILDGYKDRNPFLMINAGALMAANSLNKFAQNGNAANLALRRLGKNATTKELNDEIMKINQGFMRFQMVALGAAVTSYLFYGALHKGAMENKAYASSFNTMVSNVAKALQPMFRAFREIAIAIFDFITKMAKLVQAFNKAHPAAAKFIQTVMLLIPALTLILAPLAIGIGALLGLQGALFSLWAFIGPVVTGLAAMSATVWVVAAAIVAAGIAINKLGGFGATFDFLKQKAVDAFNGIKEAIKNFMDGGMESVLTAFKTLLPTIIGGAIGGIPGLLVGLGLRFLPALAQGIQGGAGSISTVITNVFSKIQMFIQNQLPQLLTAGLMIVQNLILGVVQALPMFVQAFMSLIQGILPIIQTLLPVLLQAGLQIVMQLVTGMLQAVSTLLPVLQQFIMQIIAVIAAMLPTFINTGVQIIMMLINGIVQMLPSLISTALQLIQVLLNAIVTYLPMIVQAGIRIIISLSQGLLQNLPMIISTIIRIMAQLVAAIIRLLPSVLSAGVQIIVMLVKGIVSMVGMVLSAIGNLGSSMISKLRSIDLSSIGKNIMQGFLNGIMSMFGAIKDAVSSIGNAVMSVIQKVTNTHSPSREMFALGEYQSEGFALGIEAKRKLVDKASYTMAMQPLQAPETVSAGQTVNTTNANASNVTFSPVININGDSGDAKGVAVNVRDELEDLFGDMFHSYNLGGI